MTVTELFQSVVRTELTDIELRREWELRLKRPEACNTRIYPVASFSILNRVIFIPHS